MTRAKFAEAAAHAYASHWLTGEDYFLHVPAVMRVEGWNIYGHAGNNRLTEPQRVLMMWSDLVGQTANGGFEQFVANYESALELAYPLIAKLDWPDLFERFDCAFREQAGDPRNPRLKRGRGGADDWPANRARIIDHLARKATRFRPWARAREIAEFKRISDTLLGASYIQAVAAGEISPTEQRGAEEPATEAAEAFDAWFYREETRAASRIFVGGYIHRHRDDLCRLTD